ncbi:serpin peptidase inhibitor, clade F (alpha-2 antiplasmin, pigment epithelium derived factor), member 2b [Esox lucius]|uniref:Serpin domain-containing protein n=1 Tax=Esox lucius TaxID=8010 RepID=A0AAY5KGK3_ESOLU|nr:serpin peptidase inhibitor, clade F (alpha-2 antiplasmin, pigment epithelium derived factor), member 2b [Esox lucius]
MDLHLLSLLLFCVCRQGLTNDEVLNDSPIPLIPLMPSHPKEESGNSAPSTQEPSKTGHPSAATVPPLLVPTSGSNGDSSEEDNQKQDEGCRAQARRPKSRKALAYAIQKLGMKMLGQMKTGPEQPNVIISPLSISLILSQLALGALNETEELLMRHLHANTLPCYHMSIQNFLERLRKSDLQVATRIYLQKGFEPKPEFVNQSQYLYDSEPVTFKGVAEVNEWVEKATNGKVSDFLTSLPPNLLLMLINAVHFKGEWKARFDPRFTSKDVFYIDDKHLVNVDMMMGPKYPLSLLIDADLDAQVAWFPFKNHMSMLVVMPMNGQVNISDLATKLNISDLYDRLPEERSMQVKLPKFKLDYSQELCEALTNIGMGELFTSPNLAAIAEGPLLVSSVQHKSSMEITEEGAEAAAATTVVISRSNPSFSLNQPFFFALMDDKTQAPIFLGVITNPNPGAPAVQSSGGSGGDKNDKHFDKSFGEPPK